MSGRRRYLLDTNMLSDLVKNPGGSVAGHITRVGEKSICTSLIAAAELRYGAAKSQSGKITDRLDLVLSAIDILPLEAPTDHHYAETRHHLTSRGTPIGPNDLLIAAQALAEGLVVVTANVSEFGRIPGLALENWLDATS
ncbi:PIN domain-containing protein [Wenzhouxiangella limi]|uniref:Ribonuclease VapC n=1 Tax=Wenzhouxiangella limi TaxID=2707351 RepID=A0A845V7K3_9GAMM|nr:type II toxin-antitoxin system VapC family toxin [Wenzhouxiangella limi]